MGTSSIIKENINSRVSGNDEVTFPCTVGISDFVPSEVGICPIVEDPPFKNILKFVDVASSTAYSLNSSIRYGKNYYLANFKEGNIFQSIFEEGTSPITSQPYTELIFKTIENKISNFFFGSKISNIQVGSSGIIERLKQFAMLEKGWDSYDANPIQWSTIFKAIDFYFRVRLDLEIKNEKAPPIPFVAPLSDGDIQFEWRTCYKELLIEIPEDKNNEIEYLKIEKTLEGETETEGKFIKTSDAVKLVTDWLL